MFLKFPSGKLSVNIQDLRTKDCDHICGVCEGPWAFKSSGGGCIKDQIFVLHPCQHLVGDDCWSWLPHQDRDHCRVCTAKVSCFEILGVYAAVDRFAPSYGSQVVPTMDASLEVANLSTILYFMNLRTHLGMIKEADLLSLLSSHKSTSPIHRGRLVIFLTNLPPNDPSDEYRNIEIALSAFNMSRGTTFNLNHLKKALPFAEQWVQKRFAAILDGHEKTNKAAAAVEKLEEELAGAKAELKRLEDRQAREGARQVGDDMELAVEGIRFKAREEVEKAEQMARDEVDKIESKAKEEIEKIHSKANKDISVLRYGSSDIQWI